MNGTLYPCDICNKRYKSQSGLKRHRKNCTRQTRDDIVDITSPIEDTSVENNQQEITSRFEWGKYEEAQFVKMLNAVYDKVVFWRKNIFLLPSGKSGKQCIEETAGLINSSIHNSLLQDVAFKAIMVMPNLLLQEPGKNSKSKDHLEALNRRLNLWKEGELTELLIEGETMPKSLSDSKRVKTIAELSKKINYMKKGNISAAVKLLTNNMQDGILPLNNKTLNKLKEKHPKSKNANNDVLLTGIPQDFHPIMFGSNDEEMIRKAAIKTKGGSGPSAMDADGWRRILCSNNFGDANVDLRKAIANFIKKICTEKVSAVSIEAFVACRLIPLDKNPGLRPIGVGEILCRITGKAIVSVLKKEVVSSAGSLQVCAGQEAGSEAAISILCPAISTFVTNCYATPARLLVIGGSEIKSNEGNTQGDPVPIVML